MSESDALPLDAFEQQITEIEDSLTGAVRATVRAVPEHRLLIQQAEWHARGVLYHCHATYTLYRKVAEGVVARTVASPQAIVMYTREMQELLFEFYALAVLGRITLDQLKKYVAPTFATNLANLPNSVTDMLKGETDCPLYACFLPRHGHLLRYLLDVRDCLVHHRSFATSDNTVAVRAETDEADLPEDLLQWHEAVARVTFREVASDGVAVNILLPDAIFEYRADGTRESMVRRFAYEERVNLLSQCREFAKLAVGAVVAALDVLQTQRTPLYTWHKADS